MSETIKIIKEPIAKEMLYRWAKNQFGNMLKAVVDIEGERMAVCGELHADEEAVLLENGSCQQNLWGINLYLDLSSDDWIEFDSMINIRPSEQNNSRGVENPSLQNRIREIVGKLVLPCPE